VQWLDKPEKGTTNPLLGTGDPGLGPAPGLGREAEQRRVAAARVAAADPAAADGALDVVEAATVTAWDDELERLLAEARADRGRIEVRLPSSLSATALARLRDDRDGFLHDLVRPMPRPPSPSARFGTRFHAWVEARFGQQQLLDPDDLPGRADTGIDDEAELAELVTRFGSGPFGDREPHAVEAPFALVLAGQVVRGRIDAVYRETLPDGSEGFLVVDWKTNREQTADPLQLAVYRLAWAELQGVPVERVRAAFHYVRTGDTVEPADLPGRAGLEALLTGPVV
jgi:DNA helicase-2/ATP-dependent DNA helicase PcrA